jgi:hypothetical protein
MKADIYNKMSTIVNNLKKSERALVTEENRNLRQLDKLEHMQKGLSEDFTNVKESLEMTDKLKQRAIANFDAIERENLEEQKKLE